MNEPITFEEWVQRALDFAELANTASLSEERRIALILKVDEARRGMWEAAKREGKEDLLLPETDKVLRVMDKIPQFAALYAKAYSKRETPPQSFEEWHSYGVRLAALAMQADPLQRDKNVQEILRMVFPALAGFKERTDTQIVDAIESIMRWIHKIPGYEARDNTREILESMELMQGLRAELSLAEKNAERVSAQLDGGNRNALIRAVYELGESLQYLRKQAEGLGVREDVIGNLLAKADTAYQQGCDALGIGRGHARS